MTLPVLLMLLLSSALTSAASAQISPSPSTPFLRSKADVIFTHANIYTGVPETQPGLVAGRRAVALAIRGDRILAVGTSAEIDKLKGPATQIVDLGGHFLMPGFNDAHLHLAGAGLDKANVDMTGSKSLDEFRERLRARCRCRRSRRMDPLAADGMKLSGPSKSFLPAGTSMKSVASIP